MEKRMRNWDSYGILRVGTSITIGSQFLPGYVKAFNHLYPGTEVHAVVASSEQLEKKVLTNEIDFALIEGIVHSPTINSEPYMEDRLSVICSANGAFKQGIGCVNFGGSTENEVRNELRQVDKKSHRKKNSEHRTYHRCHRHTERQSSRRRGIHRRKHHGTYPRKADPDPRGTDHHRQQHRR